MHDGLLSLWHHIDQHLRSRHFWTGVGITLVIVGIVTLLLLLAMEAPVETFGTYPTGMPYGPVQ